MRSMFQPVAISLSETQQILSDALKLTSVHVDRVLRRLRLEGVMEINSHSLLIVKFDELSWLAGFDSADVKGGRDRTH